MIGRKTCWKFERVKKYVISAPLAGLQSPIRENLYIGKILQFFLQKNFCNIIWYIDYHRRTTLTVEAAHKACGWIRLQQLVATEVCLHPETSQAMTERSRIQLPKQKKILITVLNKSFSP